MVILILETYPVASHLLKNAIRGKKYQKEIFITERIMPSDVLFSDERYFWRQNVETGLFLLPGDSKIINPVRAKSTLFCGMHALDAVTFSSIGENDAMICLQKEAEFMGIKIPPFETKVPFDRNFSVGKNVVAGFITALADIYFGEEKWKRNFI